MGGEQGISHPSFITGVISRMLGGERQKAGGKGLSPFTDDELMRKTIPSGEGGVTWLAE
jgi:hypothetical protein